MPGFIKLQFFNIPVMGTTKDIEDVVRALHIEHIIIAIPSLTKKELNRIFEQCAKTNAKTQIVPKLEDIVTGKVSVSQFRDVQVEDLLGREPVELDIESISSYIENKVILVTGAGGSIGSEICRQVCQFRPKKSSCLDTAKTAFIKSTWNCAINIKIKSTLSQSLATFKIASACLK